jgi:hypothetical protein
MIICVRGSDPCSFLSTLAGGIIVTLILDRCFIICDISHSIFTSVVLSLAVPNFSPTRESRNKY